MKGQISSVKGSLLPQFSYYTLGKLIRFFQTFRIGFLTPTSPHLIWRISSGPTFFSDHESAFLLLCPSLILEIWSKQK